MLQLALGQEFANKLSYYFMLENVRAKESPSYQRQDHRSSSCEQDQQHKQDKQQYKWGPAIEPGPECGQTRQW